MAARAAARPASSGSSADTAPLADLGLFALDPLEQHAQITDGFVDARVHVTELREAFRHRRHREVLGLDVGQLVPGHGSRDRGIGRPRTEYAEATVRSRAFWL